MFSIIICTFNRAESLRQTLFALQRQNVPAGIIIEIVVVDNNSCDKTKIVIEEVASCSKWPLRVILEENQGLSFARNKGIEVSTGKFLVFTDDDVIPAPDWLENIVAAFNEYGADCVSGKILPQWPDDAQECIKDERLRTRLWGILALQELGPDVLRIKDESGPLFYGANMAFKKNVFDEVGLFRTDLGVVGNKHSLGEDTDMMRRLIKAGKSLVYTPDAVVWHRIAADRLKMTYLRKWRFNKGVGEVLQYPNGAVTLPPFWLIKECVLNGCATIFDLISRNKTAAVSREMQFWLQSGQIVGRLKKCLNPESSKCRLPSL